MRVCFVILDSLPHGSIGPETTPNLWNAVASGGWAPDGGRSLPISVTYSNHAAFATGLADTTTGVWGNHAWDEAAGDFIHAATAGPRGTTIFDRCAAAGRRSVAAMGDHLIVATMGAEAADACWPPTPEIADGTPVDAYGYARDEAVLDALATMDRDSDLIVVHLNEPDTALHLHGPGSDEAIEQVRRSDASFGAVIDMLSSAWDDTVVLAVSDHEQELLTSETCIDLRSAAREQGLDAIVSHEGTGAMIIGTVDAAQVAAIECVGGAADAAPGAVYAWTRPGEMFGRGPVPTRGNHGSPRCRRQMAVVTGGHPAAATIADRLEATTPTSLTWAPLIGELLDL